ncbi:MAG: hypothetical protein LBF67_04080 [Prevotellaceae bacterium]|jgi:hypothetical protein|nr:hypothetical protein [Prevotellaceae bacterium]
MDDIIKMRLYDILSVIQEVESFFLDRPKQFESYRNDLRTKRAVERNIAKSRSRKIFSGSYKSLIANLQKFLVDCGEGELV